MWVGFRIDCSARWALSFCWIEKYESGVGVDLICVEDVAVKGCEGWRVLNFVS